MESLIIKIELPVEQINIILQALGNGVHNEVRTTIDAVVKQANEQISAAQSATPADTPTTPNP